MPSVSAKVETQAAFMDSFKQAIIVIEHKIRNLEKRKGKLDAYKQEQEAGKELNADQLAAVAKYNEVIQQLDFSRDLVKQLGQIGEETNRMYKKQQKKEQIDRAIVENERYRQLLIYQRVLDKILNNQRVRQDFLNGALGAVKLTPEDISSLDEFASLICPDRDDPNFLQQVTTAAEHISFLFQGKTKPIAGKTYKEIQALLLSISSCDYFDPQKQQLQQQQQSPPNQQPPTFNEEHHQQQQQQQQLAPEPTTSIPAATNNVVVGPAPVIVDPVPAQIIHQQESAYNFIQESQIDIESPHMDPAVVSFVPPQQQQQQSQNVYISNNTSVDNINSGLTEMSLNSLNTKNNEEIDEINQWEDNNTIPNSNTYNSNATNPIDNNGRGDGVNNMFDKRGYRGSGRGRGGRGNNTSYVSRGGPRGGRGGFQNGGGRGGYRGDRTETDSDGNVFDANRRKRGRGVGGGYQQQYSNAPQGQNVPGGGYASSAPQSNVQQSRTRTNQVAPNRLR